MKEACLKVVVLKENLCIVVMDTLCAVFDI